MRKCRQCKRELPPKKKSDKWQSLGWCDVDCMSTYGREKSIEQREKAWRKEKRDRKERIKSKSDHAREAQQVFNSWVRERDAAEPCISCGRHHQGQYHAGHYRSVGAAPELRFEPLNVHKQCAPCNNHLSGNAIEYRIRLVEKIGQDAVEWLEGLHEPKRYTIEELKEIKALYRRKLRELKRNNDTD